ncbi:MAG TPA: RluA family pseudouridine synthase [Actinomycetota bacterium]|nr:RluA family pseudouridine synthase [Actinomycetota bacterium]
MRFVVPDDAAGARLDAWLAGAGGWSRREVQDMVEAGRVTREGGPAAKSHRLVAGEVIEAEALPERTVEGPDAEYRIVVEDDHLAIVAKPAGVVVHPAPGTRGPTLVDALARVMALAPAAGGSRPGIVHRLDKDTSGLLVVAKTDDAYRGLVAAMQARKIARTYQALVAGVFGMPAGRIEAPVGRSQRDRTRMAVAPGGREAVTEFTVSERFERPAPASLLEVHLHTGRTHQIRVHLAHIQHPVVGDTTYGRAAAGLARALGLHRPFLHALRLEFVHPVTGIRIEAIDPLPEDLRRALSDLRSVPN